jgi:hypothetical protein
VRPAHAARQDFLGAAATQYPEIVTIIDTGISVLCNALFIIAIIYAFAAIALVIWPQSLVKVPSAIVSAQ